MTDISPRPRFRFTFQLQRQLSAIERERFLGEIAGGPVAPDEAEVGLTGAGWVEYADLTPGERAEIEQWLNQHPLVASSAIHSTPV